MNRRRLHMRRLLKSAREGLRGVSPCTTNHGHGRRQNCDDREHHDLGALLVSQPSSEAFGAYLGSGDRILVDGASIKAP